MSKSSAGILLYRFVSGGLQVLLAHPGGPYFKNKDSGFWGIPKGEIAAGEDPLAAAIREFAEETGLQLKGSFRALTPVKLKSGKTVQAFACEGDFQVENLRSNYFSLDWPPGSGIRKEFPEIDKAGWFAVEEARNKTNPQIMALVDELKSLLTDPEKKL